MPIKILWTTAVPNHYKIKFLDQLSRTPDISLILLVGHDNKNQDIKISTGKLNFEVVSCDVSKAHYGFSLEIMKTFKELFPASNRILVPAEKKNLLLLIYACILRSESKRKYGSAPVLFSYNHPVFKSGSYRVTKIDVFLTKVFYRIYDRVIFYTETSCKSAIEKKLIAPEKAFWANNTIDEEEVNKYYEFQYPPSEDLRILFIGRLIPSKRIDLLLDYYSALKGRFNIVNRSLKLEIIGDGPLRDLIRSYIARDMDIIWHGTLTEEKKISPIMARSTVVFIPGASGLSINHAFAYGRPYITLQSNFHGPEISYLEDGENGLLLTGNIKSDVEELYSLLTDSDKINALCSNARTKGLSLSVKNWVDQMKNALEA